MTTAYVDFTKSSYYKFFCSGLLFCFFIFLLAELFVCIFIDPVGIWGVPDVYGVNHYKARQGRYLDVCRPYEYVREKPEVVYLGGSQAFIGFSPKNEGEYMFGLPSLTMADMKEYFRFMCKAHKPKVIYLCIQPMSFGQKHFLRERKGFSAHRLQWVSDGGIWFLLRACKDTFSLHGCILQTVRGSWAHNEGNLFFHGHDTLRGEAENPNSHEYYRLMNAMIDYDRWEYSQQAMECFQDIVNKAKEEGISLIVFIAPCSVDRYAMVERLGYWPEVQRIKREVAKIVPIYDFAFINELTKDRQTYFYDAVHFKSSLGEKLKPILEGKASPEPYGYLLTPETCDAAFAAEDAAWEKWKSENAEYVQALTECIESGRKPEVGDFAKYIGF